MSEEEKAYREGFTARDTGQLEPQPSLRYETGSTAYSAYVEGYLGRARGAPHLYDETIQYQEEMFV